MKTILVPISFTEVSKNAAQYAVELADQLNYEKVILYNAYETPIPQNTDPMGIVSGPLTMYDVQEFKTISENGLVHLKDGINYNVEKISVQTISEYGGMTTGEVDEICQKLGVDLIITGVADDGFLDETESDAINLAKSTTIPLIAVPKDYNFVPLKNIVLACDLKKVAETVPFGTINKILNETQAKFYVLHIQETDDDTEPQEEKLVLHNKFDSFNAAYHYVKNPDFMEAINLFADENSIDLIITIPKKHGWLEGLFKKSHLKALTFNSHIPLLIVHE